MYSVKEKKEHTEFALEAASQLLQYYNNFFEITYPLKKLGERARTHTHTGRSFRIPIWDIFFQLTCLVSPWPLSDLVAIPDFLAGAMENWGLITFRETTLLVGKNSSLLEKQVVASVVAHELAHQVRSWFFLTKKGFRCSTHSSWSAPVLMLKLRLFFQYPPACIIVLWKYSVWLSARASIYCPVSYLLNRQLPS